MNSLTVNRFFYTNRAKFSENLLPGVTLTSISGQEKHNIFPSRHTWRIANKNGNDHWARSTHFPQKRYDHTDATGGNSNWNLL